MVTNFAPLISSLVIVSTFCFCSIPILGSQKSQSISKRYSDFFSLKWRSWYSLRMFSTELIKPDWMAGAIKFPTWHCLLQKVSIVVRFSAQM